MFRCLEDIFACRWAGWEQRSRGDVQVRGGREGAQPKLDREGSAGLRADRQQDAEFGRVPTCVV